VAPADVQEIKERIRAAWSLGSYPELARLLEPAARAVVDAVAVSAGQELLDVGAGNGNVAVLAAREGASAVASDITPAMVELGRARSRAEGVDVEWVEADAEELPFGDRRFDCVASVFGAMFAPRPERAASEMARVLRPGGTLAMANWTPDGFMGRMFAIGREYQPMPDGIPPATEWGRPEVASERLSHVLGAVGCELRTVEYAFPSAAAMLEFFEEHAGPSHAARRSMPAEAHEEMHARTLELAERLNQASDGTLRIDAEYLLVVARRPG
jgi:SAM-dependent methyltransferase